MRLRGEDGKPSRLLLFGGGVAASYGANELLVRTHAVKPGKNGKPKTHKIRHFLIGCAFGLGAYKVGVTALLLMNFSGLKHLATHREAQDDT